MQLVSTLALMAIIAPLGLPPLTVIMVVFTMLFNYYQVGVKSATVQLQSFEYG